MLKTINNCSLSRWRLLAEIRKRRQLAMALTRQQQEQQPQQQQPQQPFNYDDLFSSAAQPSQSYVQQPTVPAQQVLSLLQQNPNQPIAAALSQASFPPHPEHLLSLFDNLQSFPHLALQTLIWSLRCPDFQVSPLLGPRIAPILPLPKPPSVDRFLADAHAFWMQPDIPVPVAIVDTLLSLYCYAAPTLDDILEVFHSIRRKGFNSGVQHYNQVMQAAVSKQHNQVDKAQLLFKHMLKNGPTPNAISYNILIYGLGEAGDSGEALRLFEEMMASNLPVNEATFSSLISSIVKTGELDKAAWLMKEMKYNGVRPSAETYALILPGLCEKGKHENAASLLNDMRAEGLIVDDRTHQAMVSSLSQALGVQEAEAYRLLYTQREQPEL